MLSSIFDGEILNALSKVNINYLQEIRLRVNCPLKVCYFGKWYYVTTSGLDNSNNSSIIVQQNLIDNIVLKASNNSLYTVSEQIKKGYITLKNSIRIGVCGDAVFEKGFITNFTKITSLCIRIPHLILGKAKQLLSKLNLTENLGNIIILSSPGKGKTTLLKDIAIEYSKLINKNVVIVDEKNEFRALQNYNLDIIYQIDKFTGINYAVRNLNPDIIITDEIGVLEDYNAIFKANISGCKIICSKHASNLNELLDDINIKALINSKIFDFYIFLSDTNGKGTIENVYDKNLNLMDIKL